MILGSGVTERQGGHEGGLLVLFDSSCGDVKCDRYVFLASNPQFNKS